MKRMEIHERHRELGEFLGKFLRRAPTPTLYIDPNTGFELNAIMHS